MSFDPEKVARWNPYETITQMVVAASDYDELLALYRTLHTLEPVWRHLVKRMYDEMGTTKAEDFIKRVQAGEHDVPSPWSRT